MKEWSEEGPRQPRIEDQVLALLSDTPGTIAFSGLRRTLKVHPESLVRALRRLERSGAVTRSSQGYALRDPVGPRPEGPPSARTVASVHLPHGASGSELLGRLAGRWVGSLRWLGIYDRPGDPWLVWTIGHDRGHAMLSVRNDELKVMTDRPSEDPRSDDAAYALLGRALEAVRSAPEAYGEDEVSTYAREYSSREAN
jgi:hypothetical protein